MKERASWILEKPVLSSPQVEAEWIIVGGHPLVWGTGRYSVYDEVRLSSTEKTGQFDREDRAKKGIVESSNSNIDWN